jgi:hypothetical protein
MTANTMITEAVYIETQLETLTSFGIRVSTGEQVFIAARVARKYGIEEDQTRELTMLPNFADNRPETPWKAVGASVADAARMAETPAEAPTPLYIIRHKHTPSRRLTNTEGTLVFLPL